jgi:ABC-type sulfate/molybdate transport systems ATPase subunit
MTAVTTQENLKSGLRLEGVRKRVLDSFGDFTLAADFSLGQGERAALIGKSGIGKTTLLRLIAGLESLDSGRVWISGQDVTDWTPQKRRVGFVFQEAALFPSLDVLGNVIFGLLQQGIPRAAAEKQGMEWLEKVELLEKAHSPIGNLSGGEAQRVAFARALIWKPQLILLDEPFSALDAELRQELRLQLLRLHEQWPVPLLLVSHDAQDLEAIANVRLTLRAGPSSSLNSGGGSPSGTSSVASERAVMRDGMGSGA